MSRIAFFGSSIHSLPTLVELKKAWYPIVVAVTQPPRPVGPKRILTDTPVAYFAKKSQIPILTPPSNSDNPLLIANEEGFCQQLSFYHPDLLVVVYFGQKVPKCALHQTSLGGLNLHPSLLPKYRGASPVQWALIFGETETGLTIIKLEEEIDSGAIVAQEKEPILPNDTTATLLEKLSKKGAKLLVNILPAYLHGKIKLKPQGLSTTPYARRLGRADGFVPVKLVELAIKGINPTRNQTKNWIISKYLPSQFCTLHFALCLKQALQAFTPWPGVWTEISFLGKTNHFGAFKKTKKRLKILKAHLEGKRIVLDLVQLEGKKPVSWKVFLEGHPDIF